MKQYKWLVSTLLAAALIGGCAFLPVLAGLVQDKLAVEKVSYQQMEPVQLVFHDPDSEADRLSMLGKLYLMSYPRQVEITACETRMSEAEVAECIQAAIVPYIEAGLLPEEIPGNISITPILTYNPGSSGEYAVFWNVVVTQKKEPYTYVGLTLDDETGKLLGIGYSSGGRDFEGWDLHELMAAYTGIYFENLGIEPTEPLTVIDAEDILALDYIFGDLEYGEIRLEFYVTVDDFYCVFDI